MPAESAEVLGTFNWWYLYEGESSAKFLATRKKMKYDDLCCLTNEKLDPEGIYLIINNYKLFPNCMVNKKAVDAAGGMTTAIELLAESYAAYKKYECWADRYRGSE